MKRLGLAGRPARAQSLGWSGFDLGFGQTGPTPAWCFDLMIQAMSGLMSDRPKDGPPYRIRSAISDVGAGLYLTIACWPPCSAQKTGEGQWVETSLLEATVSLASTRLPNNFANASGRETGPAHRGSSPYQCFQTPTGGSPSARAAELLRKLCALIGKPELTDDPRFKSNAERVKNNELIVGLLQPRSPKRQPPPTGWPRSSRGIPAGPFLHHDESSPIRRFWRAHGGRGRARQGGPPEDVGCAAQMSATPAACAVPRRRSASMIQRSGRPGAKREPREGSDGGDEKCPRGARADAGIGSGADGYSFTDASESMVRYGVSATSRDELRLVAEPRHGRDHDRVARLVPAAGCAGNCASPPDPARNPLRGEPAVELNRLLHARNGGFAARLGVRSAAALSRQCLKQGFATAQTTPVTTPWPSRSPASR